MRKDQLNRGPTEIALIEAAERHFGVHGIEGASLRQIAQAAGLVNSYAVQYHFGDREGLVQAIFDYRIRTQEEERARIAERLEREGATADVKGLLDAIWRYALTLRDSRGCRSYAAFLLGLRRSPSGFARRLAVSYMAPATNSLIGRLRTVSGLSEAMFQRRIEMLTAMYLDSISRADAGDPLYRGMNDEDLLTELVAMGEAALSAPTEASSPILS